MIYRWNRVYVYKQKYVDILKNRTDGMELINVFEKHFPS